MRGIFILERMKTLFETSETSNINVIPRSARLPKRSGGRGATRILAFLLKFKFEIPLRCQGHSFGTSRVLNDIPKTIFPKFLLLTILFFGFLFAQPSDDQNTLRLAQAFEQAGEYERAVQLYQTLLRKDSINYTYFDALRRCYIQLKNYDDALALSYAQLKKTPFDFTLQSSIGGLFSTAGKEKQADSVWNAVILSANKNQMFYRAVANEQANQRLFDKAIGTYLRGRRDIGDMNVFTNELAYLYSYMMDFENATREYLRLLRQNEQQFDFVQSRLASIVSKNDGLRAAAKVVAEEIQSRSTSRVFDQTIPLLRLHMWLFMEDDRYAEAFAVAKTIEQLINSNGTEIYQFADRVFREKEYTIAATAYQFALKNGPTTPFAPSAKFGYARCIEELSAQDDSTFTSQTGESITVLETQPRFSGAIALYTALAKEYPYSNIGSNSLYRIGWIRYRQMFDLDGALQMFDSVMVMSPAGPMVPTVLSTIGDIYIAQGKLDQAAKKFAVMSTSPFANQDQRTFAQFRTAEIQFFKFNFDSALAVLQPLTENLKADESNDALLLQYFITENNFQFPQALKQYARAELLARQFKVSEAVKELSDIVDVYPAAALADDALLKKAEFSIQLRRYDDALAAYQKLLDEYKNSIEKDKTQFRIGELYQFYLVDKQKAIQAYEVILEKYPFSLFTEEARKRIRQLRGDAI